MNGFDFNMSKGSPINELLYLLVYSKYCYLMNLHCLGNIKLFIV